MTSVAFDQSLLLLSPLLSSPPHEPLQPLQPYPYPYGCRRHPPRCPSRDADGRYGDIVGVGVLLRPRQTSQPATCSLPLRFFLPLLASLLFALACLLHSHALRSTALPSFFPLLLSLFPSLSVTAPASKINALLATPARLTSFPPARCSRPSFPKARASAHSTASTAAAGR